MIFVKPACGEGDIAVTISVPYMCVCCACVCVCVHPDLSGP